MKVVYFLIVSISLATSMQGADKNKGTDKRNRTPSLPIPSKKAPDSSSPSSGSFPNDLFQSPASWDSSIGRNNGSLTDDLNEMTSSTDFDKGKLWLPSPVNSPRGDRDEGPAQKKSCCAKFFCYVCCCCCCKKKTPSEYKAIS